MKLLSSSPYATFNLKEWNSVVGKNNKYVNIPIKVQKKCVKTFTFKKLEKVTISKDNNQSHKQMQIVFS